MITIELMQPEDVDACIALGRRMHAESDCADMEFSDKECREFGSRAGEAGLLFLVARSDDEIVGFFIATVTQTFFGEQLITVDVAVYVAPEHRGTKAFYRLLKAYRGWAAELGATRAYLGTSVDMPQTDKVYSRAGFDRVGGVYRSVLEEG